MNKRMTTRVPERASRLAAWTIALAAAVGLAGCADMAGIASKATLRDAAAFHLPANEADAIVVDSRWWTAFGDPQLDRLIDKAIAGNPNLQSTQARLMRAQSAIESAESARKPTLAGAIDLTRQRLSENYIYPSPLGGSVQNFGNLQLNGSWEIDFFGKHRSALDAAIGSANAAAADAQAARLLLASNVARGYLQWARLNAQLTVAERTLAQRDETLRLVRDRVSAGLDTRLELNQSEGGLPEARQQIEALKEQIALAQHALDALVGEPDATRALAPPALQAVKSIPLQAVIPADLLGRRADIVAARWRVEAATQDVANARTQFYPNVNLVAFVGMQSLGFDNLVKASSGQWGIGPAIRLPIFEGGKLRANLRGKAADQDAAIESYNAAVLDAVRDVADNVSSTQSIARQQQEQAGAQRSAEAAYDIAVQRYRAGLGNYLNVLTAETTVLAQRRQAVDLAARSLDAQVGLARALGGGWKPEPGLALGAVPRTEGTLQ